MAREEVGVGEARCPICGAPLVRTPEGLLVCANGHVVEEYGVDSGPEWRAFDAEEESSRSRAGPPLSERLHDRGVTTTISRSRDPRYAKLAALHRRLRVEGHAAEVEAFQELNRVAALLELPGHVVDTAAVLLRKALRAGLLRHRGGSRLREWVAALLVAASRLSSGPQLTVRDVAVRLGVPERRVARAYRELVMGLGVRPRPLDPTSYIPRIAAAVRATPAVEALAARLAAALRQRGLAQGKPPLGLAAAAVYLASILLDEKRGQTAIARAAGITDMTVRNRYRDLVDNLYIEVRL